MSSRRSSTPEFAGARAEALDVPAFTHSMLEARAAGEPDPSEEFVPDTREASRFVSALIREDQPGEQYTFQTFDDSEEKQSRLARIYHGKGNTAALTNANAEGAGIFSMISAGDGKGRKESNVKRPRAVFVDADENGAAVLAAIEATDLTPHIVVESSPSKYHVYWLLDRKFPMDKFAAVQTALACRFGTDPAVKDLPRVMRLPGFFHMKDPARPFRVRILELADHKPYSLEEIIDKLGLALEAVASSSPKTPPTREKDVIDPNTEQARRECEIAFAEVAQAAEGERNVKLRDFIYLVKERAAASDALCVEYGLRFAAEKCCPPYDESQARPTIRSAIRSARNPAGSRSEVDEVRHAAIAQEFEDLGPLPETPASTPQNPFEGQQIAIFASGKPLRWLVRDALPEAELALIIGESGAGKSFFAFDMAAAIAQGVPWRGRKTRPGRVAYITAEGAHGARSRAIAYAKYHGVPLEGLDIVVFPHAPNLMQRDDVKNLIAAVRKYAPVSVIFVDTLAATTPGMNENAFEDMGRALGHCRALHRATGALVVLIHHLGKDSSKGARGHSSLKAAADAEITVEKRGGIRTAAVTKMKDGEQGLEMPFRLITVELGKDEDGEPITSCVIEHVEGAQEAHSERKPAGAKQRLIWEVANELAALAGEEELTVDDVLSLAKERIPYDPQSGKRDQRRAHAIRALEGLQSDGWLRIEGGQVVLCKK